MHHTRQVEMCKQTENVGEDRCRKWEIVSESRESAKKYSNKESFFTREAIEYRQTEPLLERDYGKWKVREHREGKDEQSLFSCSSAVKCGRILESLSTIMIRGEEKSSIWADKQTTPPNFG